MDEVEATKKSIFSCTDDNMMETHLYLDLPTIATLQLLHQELWSRLRCMITYGSTICKEANERYNHLHAEAAQALTNIQIFKAAGTEIRLPMTFGGQRPMRRIPREHYVPKPQNKRANCRLSNKPRRPYGHRRPNPIWSGHCKSSG